MTGGRGMQSLLSGTNRNYLPSTWSDLMAAVRQTGGALPGALGRHSKPDDGQRCPDTAANSFPITRGADPIANGQAVGGPLAVNLPSGARQHQHTLCIASALINAIPSAGDQKGALDLQARIQAEQAHATKRKHEMTVLHQTLEAQEWARKQSAREAGRCRGRVAANVASPESAVKDFDHEVFGPVCSTCGCV